MRDRTLPAADRLMYLEIASQQSARMNHLVDELFELAKLEEIGVRIEPERFQISELIQDVVQKFELTTKGKIALRGQFMPEAPLALGTFRCLNGCWTICWRTPSATRRPEGESMSG